MASAIFGRNLSLEQDSVSQFSSIDYVINIARDLIRCFAVFTMQPMRFKFSISDLLAATAVLAVCLYVVRDVETRTQVYIKTLSNPERYTAHNIPVPNTTIEVERGFLSNRIIERDDKGEIRTDWTVNLTGARSNKYGHPYGKDYTFLKNH